MTYTRQWLTQIVTNVDAAITDHPGESSRIADWMGADLFAAKRAGRIQWEAAELMLLAREMGVMPSRLVDGGS